MKSHAKFHRFRQLQLMANKTAVQWIELCQLAEKFNVERCLVCSIAKYLQQHPPIMLQIKSQAFELNFKALKHIAERHLFRSTYANASKFVQGHTIPSLVELIRKCAEVLDQFGSRIKYPKKEKWTRLFYIQLRGETYCLVVGRHGKSQRVKSFYPVVGSIPNEERVRVFGKIFD